MKWFSPFLSEKYLTPASNSIRLIEAGTYLWAVVLAIVCVRLNYHFFYDDGFITLRYARHLAEGHGPVWNLTGPPVEGFTSPLHMLMVSALLAMHLKWLVALRLIAFSFHFVLVVFAWRFVQGRSGGVAASLAVALLVASWPLLVWDLGGLETVPFTSLLAIGTLLTLRYAETRSRSDIVWGGVLLGLACFMRPDGVVVSLVVFVSLLGSVRTRQRLVDMVAGVGAFFVVVTPWEVFREMYYHAFLPNTYYAKMYGIPLGWRISHGWGYARHFVFQPPYLIPLLLIVVLVALLRSKWCRFDFVLLLCVLGHALYVVDNGGDHMAAYRFMVPLIPLLVVSLVILLGQVGALRSAPSATAITCLLMLASLAQARHSGGYTPLNPRWRDPAGMMAEEVGRYVNVHWKPGSTVVVKVAGATPFFADGLTYIDVLGLNDPVIARRNPVPTSSDFSTVVGHLKGDGQYVISRRPDYVILAYPQGGLASAVKHPMFGEYDLIRQPAFSADYKPCQDFFEMSDYGASQMAHFGLNSREIRFIYYQRKDLSYPCVAPFTTAR